MVNLALWAQASVSERVWSLLNYSFPIGSFEIKIANVAIGIGVLLAAMLASRSLRSFVQRRIAKRAPIDPGLQYTLLRLTHYFIISLGVLYAVKIALGIDLTAFAVVFTALSVGIGFGLQFIAADIASGFILLFERPVRVGDRIVVGDTDGKVESINLRTTVMMTNDRTAIILPNSKLVSNSFTNWTYNNSPTRFSIPVSVAPNSDPEAVKQVLLRAASSVEGVLDDPKPVAQLARFGEASLDFQLLLWTLSPHTQPQIKSDVNYRIMRFFNEAGINISSQQQRGQAAHDGRGQSQTPAEQPAYTDDETIVPDKSRTPERSTLAPRDRA